MLIYEKNCLKTDKFLYFHWNINFPLLTINCKFLDAKFLFRILLGVFFEQKSSRKWKTIVMVSVNIAFLMWNDIAISRNFLKSFNIQNDELMNVKYP